MTALYIAVVVTSALTHEDALQPSSPSTTPEAELLTEADLISALTMAGLGCEDYKPSVPEPFERPLGLRSIGFCTLGEFGSAQLRTFDSAEQREEGEHDDLGVPLPSELRFSVVSAANWSVSTAPEAAGVVATALGGQVTVR